MQASWSCSRYEFGAPAMYPPMRNKRQRRGSQPDEEVKKIAGQFVYREHEGQITLSLHPAFLPPFSHSQRAGSPKLPYSIYCSHGSTPLQSCSKCKQTESLMAIVKPRKPAKCYSGCRTHRIRSHWLAAALTGRWSAGRWGWRVREWIPPAIASPGPAT
jgi:hypothetical protein